MEDTTSFKHSLKTKYQVSEIVGGKWIKPRNGHHTAWVITFSSDSIPQTIDIPGEQIITRVYPYKDKPMLCKKCQQYSHSIKFCRTSEWTRGRCGDEHPTERCKIVERWPTIQKKAIEREPRMNQHRGERRVANQLLWNDHTNLKWAHRVAEIYLRYVKRWKYCSWMHRMSQHLRKTCWRLKRSTFWI